MHEFTSEELRNIIDLHEKWLKNETDGVRADLRGADLRGADLSGADLRWADLRGADLYGADLSGADLHWANFRGADLSGADLSGADLSGADFCNADLYGADLRNADLYGAILCGVKSVPFIPMVCPDSGEFIGWKKASNYIVKLKILEDSKRSSATGRKCRCDKALVVDIQSIDGNSKAVDEITSNYDNSFVYKIGGIVSVDNFDDDRWNECAPGIHFFVNRQEAVNY